MMLRCLALAAIIAASLMHCGVEQTAGIDPHGPRGGVRR